MTEEAFALLSSAEQELFVHYPLWTTIVYGIAVIAGFLGAIILLMNKKSSQINFHTFTTHYSNPNAT
ncbi:MAG: hypothetical protein GQ574_11370 [Crocinitomix sp.]|nr:hypothetical protein [Crocinitomix sp.]